MCFVYLADVTWVGPLTTGVTPAVTAQFSKSRWFTRGWTLQELLAPRFLVFFTLEWRLLGSHQRSIVDRVRPFHEDEEPVRTSAGFSLSSHIEQVTGISVFSSPQFDEEMKSSCIARRCHGPQGEARRGLKIPLTACSGFLASTCFFCMEKASKLSSDYRRS